MQGKNNEVKKSTFEHFPPSGKGWHVVPSEGVLNKEHFISTPSSPRWGTSKAEMLFDNPPTPPYGGTSPTRGEDKNALCAKHPARGEVNDGFTLIELLVVVLIIAILAAVAVPQYQKAVLKARMTQAIIFGKAYVQAQNVYRLANGELASSLGKLDIQLPTPQGWQNSTSNGGLIMQHNSSSIEFNFWPAGSYFAENTGFCIISYSAAQFNTAKAVCQSLTNNEEEKDTTNRRYLYRFQW